MVETVVAPVGLFKAPARDPMRWRALPAFAQAQFDCPAAFGEPRFAPLADTAFTPSYVAVLLLVQHVYLLCVTCGEVVLPEELRGRVSTVDGRVMDQQCGMVPQAYVGDHGHEVSLSHAAAIAHAAASGHDTAAFLESDTVGNHKQDGLEIVEDVKHTLRVMPRADWNVVRLGWRPFSVERHTVAFDACAHNCQCVRFGKTGTCMLRNDEPSAELDALAAAAAERGALDGQPGTGQGGGGSRCDLRGSEAYILHQGSYEIVHNALTRWTPGPRGTPWTKYLEPSGAGPGASAEDGALLGVAPGTHWLPVIDYGALQSIPMQVLANPLVSLQYEQPEFMADHMDFNHEDRVTWQGRAPAL